MVAQNGNIDHKESIKKNQTAYPPIFLSRRENRYSQVGTTQSCPILPCMRGINISNCLPTPYLLVQAPCIPRCSGFRGGCGPSSSSPVLKETLQVRNTQDRGPVTWFLLSARCVDSLQLSRFNTMATPDCMTASWSYLNQYSFIPRPNTPCQLF